jgi:hypothetical protein
MGMTKQKNLPKRKSAWILVVLLSSIAGVVLYRSAYSASDFVVIPDAVEYALGAHRFVFEGSYTIQIQGQQLPPRYPPWFSILVLSPAYVIFGPEPGNAIYPVTALGIAGLVLAFFLGRQLTGDSGGILAAFAVLSLPVYRILGRLVMTDVPCAVLLLGLCLVYVRVRVSTEKKNGDFLLAGVLIATSTLFRPVAAATMVPFLPLSVSSAPLRQRLLRISCLVIPLCLAAVITLLYNASTFGSATRNGYKFWCPVPYDYAWLTFSTSYLVNNLKALWASRLPLWLGSATFAFGMSVWLRSCRLATRDMHRRRVLAVVEFLLLGCGPIVVFLLFYFWPDIRFYLPALALSAVLTGAIAGACLPEIPRVALLAILLLTLCVVVEMRHGASDLPPYRRLAADRVRTKTPDQAWIISAIDPAYLEYMIGKDSKRRVIPISRRVEYASKLIAYKRIQDPVPPPLNCVDHRCQGLINGGARDAVPYVASENLSSLQNELTEGTRVFVDTAFMTAEDVEILNESKLFRFSPCAEFLYELHNDHS